MKRLYILPVSLLALTLISALALSSVKVSADNTDVVDNIAITVPQSCTMTGTGTDSHTATINPGTYNSSIGLTTIKAFCNDNEGFSIYAIGYTDEEDGKNVLTSSALGSTSDIATSTATSGNNSAWAMKLAVPQSPTPTYPMTIQSDTEGSFSSFHTVPDDYTLVAKRTSSTDVGTNAEGSSLTTTYQTYISQTQPAGTYTGKVKYTMVHPHDANAPIANPATLDTGQTVNIKLKSLAATVINGQDTTIIPTFDPGYEYDWDNASDDYIKSVSIHTKTPAPSGFTPTEKNTISSSNSSKPIYIIFDDTTGIMHFYTEGGQIVLPSDSSFMFYLLRGFTDLSFVSDWDSSNVTDMHYMFYYAGRSATTFAPDLSSWDTSNVINMNNMFYGAGYNATTFTLNLSSWNTSNVTDMSWMFASAGSSATTWSIGDLSSWNTSSVTSMYSMFSYAGRSATTWSIGNLSSWNTTNVTNMNGVFFGAGYSATTFSLDLSSWNTSNVTNMYNMFSNAGYSATTFSLDLSSWNTSNVANIGNMFSSAGSSATTWSVTIPPTNGNNINNTTNYLYGQTTSKYSTPPSGKSFTLAQP